MIIVGLDLSLTGAGICVLEPRWRPGKWDHVHFLTCGESLTKTATPEQKALRLLGIVSRVRDAITGARRLNPKETLKVYVENYSFGMQYGAHQLGEIGGCVRLTCLQLGCVATPVNHSAARKFLLGVGTGKGIKKEVHKQLKLTGAPFKTGDEHDAFVIANWARSENSLPALTLAPASPSSTRRRSKT